MPSTATSLQSDAARPGPLVMLPDVEPLILVRRRPTAFRPHGASYPSGMGRGVPIFAVASLWQRELVLIDLDQIDTILNSDVGEGHRSFVASRGNPYHAVFDAHYGGNVE
jgi:hypothetical protein